MPQSSVLVDTWAILALANSRDAWHDQAVEISRQLTDDGRSLVTTDWILTEFLGFAARPPHREAAVRMVESLRTAASIEVFSATRDGWEQGFRLYESRADKSWSLVDCISMQLCAERGIGEVFTGDRHFEQAGLKILLT
ncbi:MAG: type II toxin-antitoxin system VapC family toxin [Pirellulaceae bacterium]